MKVAFSGDLFVGESLRSIPYDTFVKDMFSEFDYSFACCEGPVCKGNIPVRKKIGPVIRQDESISSLLPLFSHMSLANDHSMDYNLEGLLQTKDFLHEHGVKPCGAGTDLIDTYRPVVLSDGKVSVAVFCCAESQYGCFKTEDEEGGFAWMLNPIIYLLIQEYKKSTDYLVMYLHAGLEDESIPLKEWREIYRTYIDFGADLVVAGHPHIIQGKEEYKGKWIYYSLGNFFCNGNCSSGYFDYIHSLVLCCDFEETGLSLRERFVDFEDGKVRASKPGVDQLFGKLSSLLLPCHSDQYDEQYEDIIIKKWENNYKPGCSFPIWRQKRHVVFYREWFNKLMENYVKRCFLPPMPINHLYHNMNNETHRFVISRAFSMLEKTS